MLIPVTICADFALFLTFFSAGIAPRQLGSIPGIKP
jgi:hypothetical protein